MIRLGETRYQPLILAPILFTNALYYTSTLVVLYVATTNYYLVSQALKWTGKKVLEGNRKLKRSLSSPSRLQRRVRVSDLGDERLDHSLSNQPVCRESESVLFTHGFDENKVSDNVEEKCKEECVCQEAEKETGGKFQAKVKVAFEKVAFCSKWLYTIGRQLSAWCVPREGVMSVFHFLFMLGLMSTFGLMHISVLLGRYVCRIPPTSLVRLYACYPLKPLSRLWGRLNTLTIPDWLRTPLFSIYCKLYGVQVHEALVEDLAAFPNLSTFFRRSLKPGLRPQAAAELTCPADGRLLYAGAVTGGRLEQVKGVTYCLHGFLGGGHTAEVSPGRRLYHAIIYLAPGDYHRFHAPARWSVTSRTHFPGELFSVQPSVARWLAGLFSLNERVVYRGRWAHGFFSVTPVGAVNVGSINVTFDTSLQTNLPTKFPAGAHFDYTFSQEHTMEKGDLMGDFNLGSTVVLVFEAPESFSFCVTPGSKVKVGEALGSCDHTQQE